ncbi:hypothetical protein [Fulvivirga ligni]|uniref:hypothetical protein n=1 Tax=Fulvivirga ligni TaxID=2904246 RepID=UPI001F2CDA54|nr:hypothetical protein [Fulvivirga ligni]UII22867.1 hypothetical protein LVD16_06480 [Fulvivirga ligni]
MQKPALIFESSPWFLLLCVLAGFVYAYLLYQKKGPWSVNAKRLLFALRLIVVSVLAALLVSPILKQITNNIEEPTIVVAIDDSHSIAEVSDSVSLDRIKSSIFEEADQLKEDFNIEYRSLSGETSDEPLSSLSFQAQSTDLNKFLGQIRNDYEGRNSWWSNADFGWYL